MGEEAVEDYVTYLSEGKGLGYEKASKLLREVLRSRSCFWRGQSDIEREMEPPSSRELEDTEVGPKNWTMI